MILGQSAGVAAAMAADAHVNVQDLPYPKLQERLLSQGQVLELPDVPEDPSKLPGVVDDADAELIGSWKRSTNFKPHVGSGYVHDDKVADGKSQAIFRFKAPTSGKYTLKMAYSAHETRAKNVPITISSGSHEKQIEVDQTLPLPEGELFQTVGSVQLESGVETVITISNTGTNGFVIIDAIQFTPLTK